MVPSSTRGRLLCFDILRVSALLGILLTACAACTGASGLDAGRAEVRALSGAGTRVVWVQHDGKDPEAIGDQLVLMGLDSEDGKGERVILGQPGSYVKPMITPRGDRIVFSTRVKPGPAEIFIV